MSVNNVDYAKSQAAEVKKYRDATNELKNGYQQQLENIEERNKLQLSKARERYNKDRVDLEKRTEETLSERNDDSNKRINEYKEAYLKHLDKIKKTYAEDQEKGRLGQKNQLEMAKESYDTNVENSINSFEQMQKQQRENIAIKDKNTKEKLEKDINNLSERSLNFRDKLTKDSHDERNRIIREKDGIIENDRADYLQQTHKMRNENLRKIENMKSDFDGQREISDKNNQYLLQNSRAQADERVKRANDDASEMKEKFLLSQKNEIDKILDEKKKAIEEKNSDNAKDVNSLKRIIYNKQNGAEEAKKLQERDALELERQKSKSRKEVLENIQKDFVSKIGKDQDLYNKKTDALKDSFAKEEMEKSVKHAEEEKNILLKNKDNLERVVHEFGIRENETDKFNRNRVDMLEKNLRDQRDRFIQSENEKIKKLTEKSAQSVDDIREDFKIKQHQMNIDNIKEKYELAEDIKNTLGEKLNKTREALEGKLVHEQKEKEQIEEKLVDKIARLEKKNNDELKYKEFLMQETSKQEQLVNKDMLEQKDLAFNERYKSLRNELINKLDDADKANKKRLIATTEGFENTIARQRMESAIQIKNLEITSKQEKDRMKSSYELLLKNLISQYEDRIAKMKDHYNGQIENLKNAPKAGNE